MTNLTDIEYFYLRKELREKYFTDNNFTQLIDIPDFQKYLKPNSHTHIGEMVEAHFISNYLIQQNQHQTLNKTYDYDGLEKLNIILSNPNQYLNPKSNIQAVYDYLKELSQYNTEQWLNNRLNKTLNLFEKYKTNLLIANKPSNNQQLWF